MRLRCPTGRAFRQISDELRTQYLLAYYPSQRLADSDFRRIEVKVNGQTGGLRIQSAPPDGILHVQVALN